MNEENQGKYFRAERCVVCRHQGDLRVTLLLGFLHNPLLVVKWPDACTQAFASRNEVAAEYQRRMQAVKVHGFAGRVERTSPTHSSTQRFLT
jgi:hypothetical protein